MQPLSGSFRVLILYDIAEQILLDRLRDCVTAVPARREPSFRHPAPEYVRFERPPVIEQPEPVTVESGEQFQVRIKYFDYGVVSVELELPFKGDWEDLVRLSNRWTDAPELEACSLRLLNDRKSRIRPALVQPYDAWLNEDYYIIRLSDVLDADGKRMTGPETLAARGGEIAQIVRGESRPLAAAERDEVLHSSMSYYPSDLLVVGWVGALIYDTPEAAEPAVQLLEYANTQLLEFRHYDDLLTQLLQRVYKSLDQGGGLLRRWRMGREAARLNTLRLDVRELTERTDNAIKFLSDMFYARAYRMAAAKVGVPDYRNLVEQKLRIARELYEFMVNEFHQARAFVLEAMVVAILIIELVRLIWPA